MSAKLCKYECGTVITWDNNKRSFFENDGTAHTRERCASLREKKAPVSSSNEHHTGKAPEQVDSMTDLAAAVRELVAAIRSRPL